MTFYNIDYLIAVADRGNFLKQCIPTNKQGKWDFFLLIYLINGKHETFQSLTEVETLLRLLFTQMTYTFFISFSKGERFFFSGTRKKRISFFYFIFPSERLFGANKLQSFSNFFPRSKGLLLFRILNFQVQ